MQLSFIVALAPFETKMLADTASDYDLPPVTEFVEDSDEVAGILQMLFDRWAPGIDVYTSLGFLEEDLGPGFNRDSCDEWTKVYRVFLDRLQRPYDRNRYRSKIAEAENIGFLSMLSSASNV